MDDTDFGFHGTERYEVVSILGGGGMGVVYRAYDRETESPIALKVLEVSSPEALHRFKNEFRTLQDIQHDNLISLGELGEVDGTWYFTMELVEGVDLMSHLGRVPPALRESRLRSALQQLATGLSVLHAHGKVHRDVKPSNVMVTDEGRVVLLDFGLVVDLSSTDRVTGDAIVGTTAYMAPEQMHPLEVGPPADCYSVGLMLYEALAGALPFSGGSIDVLLQKQSTIPDPPSQLRSDVPPDLDRLCVELLDTDSSKRPTAEEIVRRLAGTVTDAPSSSSSSDALELVAPRVAGTFVGRRRELGSLLAAVSDFRPGTIAIRGSSGVGKSALVRELCERLSEEQPDALILSGRCYERENVPFKGVDGVVDGLVAYLRQRTREELRAVVPENVGLLPQMFPSFRRLRGLDWVSPPREKLAPFELRRRVFVALRDLLARVADERSPVVITVDDMQWADADAWALLEQLMQPPAAPPVLLLMTARPTPEGAPIDVARAVPGPTRVVDLDVLPPDEARELAAELLERAGVPTAPAASIGRDSEGHPLFIRELVRHVVEVGPEAARSARLEDALQSRILRLSDRGRRLLRTVAAVGFPVQQSVVADAAGVGFADYVRVAAELRSAHMIRAGGSRGVDRVEPYHDRIREAALALLAERERRDLHRNIADALEDSGAGGGEPALLLHHLRLARDRARAARYAARAAAQAMEALAFDHAAEQYAAALELATDPAELRALRLDLAGALVYAGRGVEAADAYLAAAEGADAATRLDCRRRAAEQLLFSGHIESGLASIAEVLAEIGEQLPKSPGRALWALLVQRALLRLRGLGYRARDPSEISQKDLALADIYQSVGKALSLVDNVRAAYYQCRYLRKAVGLGEPRRIAQAMGVECVFLASQMVPRVRDVVARAQKLAQASDDPLTRTYVAFGTAAVQYFMDCDWEECGRTLAEAEDLLRNHYQTAGWETDSVRAFRCFCWLNSGQLEELSRRVPAYIREAERRGDLYASVSLRSRLVVPWLMNDDADDASRRLEEAMDAWLPWREIFSVQHFYALHSRVEIEIYRGRGGRAQAHLDEQFGALKRSTMLRVGLVRAETEYLQARVAVLNGDGKRAARLARSLARSRVRVGPATAPLARAGAASVRGDDEAVARALREGVAACRDAAMGAYVEAARYRLGRLIGGDEGEALALEAEAWMKGEGVADPEAFASFLVPLYRPGTAMERGTR